MQCPETAIHAACVACSLHLELIAQQGAYRPEGLGSAGCHAAGNARSCCQLHRPKSGVPLLLRLLLDPPSGDFLHAVVPCSSIGTRLDDIYRLYVYRRRTAPSSRFRHLRTSNVTCQRPNQDGSAVGKYPSDVGARFAVYRRRKRA
jgi:hypothetical protein